MYTFERGIHMMDLEKLKALGQMVHFVQDEQIFYQGEAGNCLYLLLKGTVSIYLTSDFDGREISLCVLKSGDVFGEMALASGTIRSANVKALDDVIALSINRDHFEAFVSLEPKFSINMLTTLAQRYFETVAKVKAGKEASNG